MVRILVGTLVEVSCRGGKLSLEDLSSIIEKKDRKGNPCVTAPSDGLFLVDVHYDQRYKQDYGIP